MSQIIEALEKYFRCVKLKMGRGMQDYSPAPPPGIGLRAIGIAIRILKLKWCIIGACLEPATFL